MNVSSCIKDCTQRQRDWMVCAPSLGVLKVVPPFRIMDGWLTIIYYRAMKENVDLMKFY